MKRSARRNSDWEERKSTVIYGRMFTGLFYKVAVSLTGLWIVIHIYLLILMMDDAVNNSL